MGIWNILKGKTKEKSIIIETDPTCIYSPLQGRAISLREIGDGVFSEEILGQGCGIIPSDGLIIAPFDGEVVQLAETKHAIGLVSSSGIELLIHVGLDTVDMNGNGYKLSVRVGDKVKCGQNLMSFSIVEIEKAGHSAITAVVVTNSEQYQKVSLISPGLVARSQILLQVI